MRASIPCPELQSLEAAIARGNHELRTELGRVRHELELARIRAGPLRVFEPPNPVTVFMFAGLAALIMLVGYA